MPINSAEKRRSISSIGPPFLIPGVIPDGDIGQNERPVVSWSYYGSTSLADEISGGDVEIEVNAVYEVGINPRVFLVDAGASVAYQVEIDVSAMTQVEVDVSSSYEIEIEVEIS